ncbi:MAG: hypothetical protein K6A44_02115 [bacterium]|nr:hypothetical protein [bacterium]
MAKSKTSTIFNIIGNGIKLYVQNFLTLSAHVFAPVIGMLVGFVMMFIPIYLIPKHYLTWAQSLPVLNELYMIIIIAVAALLPGLIVFKIAFWNYLLKMVSLNNMVGDILKKKVLKHHSHYTQIVSLRSKDYFLMLAIWCSIIVMGLILPFSVYLFVEPPLTPFFLIGFEFLAVFLLIVLSIYLSLSFQVFAFETSFGPMQSLEESFRLVLNNFWRMVTLMLSLFIITGILIPQIFSFAADICMIKGTIALPVKALMENLFENYPDLYTYLQALPIFQYESLDKFILETSKSFSFVLIASVISLLMLPMGSSLYTIFYFDAKKRNAPKEEPVEEIKAAKKSSKTAKKK